eukprot:gene27407-4701_t
MAPFPLQATVTLLPPVHPRATLPVKATSLPSLQLGMRASLLLVAICGVAMAAAESSFTHSTVSPNNCANDGNDDDIVQIYTDSDTGWAGLSKCEMCSEVTGMSHRPTSWAGSLSRLFYPFVVTSSNDFGPLVQLGRLRPLGRFCDTFRRSDDFGRLIRLNPASTKLNWSLLQDYYTSFPWCKCEDLPKNDPIRLGYNGVAEVNNVNYVQFFIRLVDIPPTDSKCKDADLYKIEFRVAVASKQCSSTARIGNLQRSATYEDLGGGRAILRVSQLSISQANIAAAGPEGIPFWVDLSDECNVLDFFGPNFKYAMFNTEKDCCPVAIINRGAGVHVILRLYADRSLSPAQETFEKLELNLANAGITPLYRGTIKQVTIDGRPITSVYWQTTTPTVKFTMLGLDMTDAAGVMLEFDLVTTNLATLCGGPCLYAAFNKNGNTGLCPLGTFRG